jgi:hypothetical protein
MKIVTGRWTLLLTLACMVQNCFSLIVGLRIVRDTAFINPEFAQTLNAFLADNGAVLTFSWQTALVTSISVLIVFGFIVEMITLFAKSIRLLQNRG